MGQDRLQNRCGVVKGDPQSHLRLILHDKIRHVDLDAVAAHAFWRAQAALWVESGGNFFPHPWTHCRGRLLSHVRRREFSFVLDSFAISLAWPCIRSKKPILVTQSVYRSFVHINPNQWMLSHLILSTQAIDR
jgi:hypothetical protein